MQQEAPAFARIVTVRFHPDSLALAFTQFRDVSTPLVRRQQGSLGIIGVVNSATGNTWSISLWHTLDDLERSNAQPDVVDALMAYAQWMISPFAVQSYDIVRGALAAPGSDAGAGEWVRITTVVPAPGSADAAAAILCDRLARLETRCRGCNGTLLMSQQVGNRLIAVELWSSAETLAASDPEAMSQDQRIRADVALQSLPVREEAEVFGRY